MSREEVSRWIEFYRQQPFDDYSRYQRPAAIARGFTDLKDPGLVRWLKNVAPVDSYPADHSPAAAQASPADTWTAADLNTMAAFGMRPPKVKKAGPGHG